MLDTRDGTARPPLLVHARQPGVEYFLEHVGRWFFVLTNRPHAGTAAPLPGGYILLRAPADCPPDQLPSLDDAAAWTMIGGRHGSGDVVLEDAELYDTHAVLLERR